MKRRPWIWIVGGTLLVVLALGGLYLSQQIGDPSGWPLEAQAWNREHSVPESDNAGPLYQRIGIAAPWGYRRLQVDWTLPMAVTELSALQAVRESPSFPEQEALLKEAVGRPSCFYPLDPGKEVFMTSRAPLFQLQRLTCYLTLNAQSETSRGNPGEGLKSLLTAARVGFHHAQGEIITQLVGTACRGMAWAAFERLATDSAPDPEALDSAADELDRLAAGRPSAKGMLELSALNNRAALEAFYRPDGFSKLGKFENDEVSPLQSTAQWLKEAALHPLPRCRRDLEEAQALLSKEPLSAADQARLNALLSGSGKILKDLLLPWMLKCGQSLRRELACERGTRILLRLRAHRLRKGAYPETLAGLGKALPDDPYTGKPFIYKKLEGDKFLLYSTGPDGKDDGGATDSRDFPVFPKGADMLFGRPPQP